MFTVILFGDRNKVIHSLILGKQTLSNSSTVITEYAVTTNYLSKW